MNNIEAKKIVIIFYVSVVVLVFFILFFVYFNPFDSSDKANILFATLSIIVVVGANIMYLLKK